MANPSILRPHLPAATGHKPAALQGSATCRHAEQPHDPEAVSLTAVMSRLAATVLAAAIAVAVLPLRAGLAELADPSVEA